MKTFYLAIFLIIAAFGTLQAQERVITGTVTDRADAQPIPGVSIRIRGTNTGTATGPDGRYRLAVPAGTTVIEFSSIGYATLPVTLGTSNMVNVALENSDRKLSEIVVTANAIRQEKRTLGYSAPTLNNEELTQGEQPNVINSLAGKAIFYKLKP